MTYGTQACGRAASLRISMSHLWEPGWEGNQRDRCRSRAYERGSPWSDNRCRAAYGLKLGQVGKIDR